MAKKVKRGKVVMWLDGAGLEVPEKYIKDSDKSRDQLVSRLVGKAKQLNMVITNAKRQMEQEIANYLQDTALREGEEWVGGTTLWDFSMDQAISIKIAKRWTFDEKLNLAKQKIDKCIESWSAGSDEKIITLVNRAFKVDSKGEVDAREIISLRQYNFTDELWKEAMDLIADSQKVQSTKTYFYFQEAQPDGKLKSIVLDFAAL